MMSGESVEEDKDVDKLKRQIQKAELSQAIKYDWENRWLKGDEYYHILVHADLYIKSFKFAKYPPKVHPIETYTEPKSSITLTNRRDYVFC